MIGNFLRTNTESHSKDPMIKTMAAEKKARIIGMGSYLPERIMTNHDLEKMVDTSDEWIKKRTGISERRIAASDEAASHMGAQAAKYAIERSGISPDDIDLVLVATMTGDFVCPATAPLIQKQLGLRKVPAMDLQAACTGHIYGLSVAKAYIESGLYKNILLVSTEKMSSVVDFSDRLSCILFGDGATAVVVSGEGHGFAIETVILGADGEQSELIIIPAGGSDMPTTPETVEQRLHYVKLDGKEVFKQAVRCMISASRECLEVAGCQKEDVTWLIPHQANMRIIDAIARGMEFPEEKIYKTVHKYGNTSASSIGIALDELTQNEKLNKGDHFLLAAFGAGLTWGAALLTLI